MRASNALDLPVHKPGARHTHARDRDARLLINGLGDCEATYDGKLVSQERQMLTRESGSLKQASLEAKVTWVAVARWSGSVMPCIT